MMYVRSRGGKDITQLLRQNRISADYYHAGLTPEERTTRQDQWIGGQTRIMVCTNASRMGIDKPDVRAVVHLNLPDSLEAYARKPGRSRDGAKSYAVLLFIPRAMPMDCAIIYRPLIHRWLVRRCIRRWVAYMRWPSARAGAILRF